MVVEVVYANVGLVDVVCRGVVITKSGSGLMVVMSVYSLGTILCRRAFRFVLVCWLLVSARDQHELSILCCSRQGSLKIVSSEGHRAGRHACETLLN